MTAPVRLLCQRVIDTFPRRDVKSELDRCSQCGESVRVADTSRDAVKIYTQVEIWCLDCGVKGLPAGSVEWEYTDAQIAEIAHATGEPPAKIIEQLTVALPSLRRQR